MWGLFNPIAFSFHIYKLGRMPAARIVINSVTHNWGRLFTVVLLALFVCYVMAVMGLLWFYESHTEDHVAPMSQGPCGNLLSCFVSYSYAGFLQAGLTNWLQPVSLPETLSDLMANESARLLFEVMFMCVADQASFTPVPLVPLWFCLLPDTFPMANADRVITSSFVISIITGIICDTFGELRMAMDDAKSYRSTTCFVTNLSYMQVPPEKTTSIMQYAYLILYLARQRKPRNTLELQVKNQLVSCASRLLFDAFLPGLFSGHCTYTP